MNAEYLKINENHLGSTPGTQDEQPIRPGCHSGAMGGVAALYPLPRNQHFQNARPGAMGINIRMSNGAHFENVEFLSWRLKMLVYPYIYIYIYIYIGGWGDESNREIVSCRAVRACVRARGLVVR